MIVAEQTGATRGRNWGGRGEHRAARSALRAALFCLAVALAGCVRASSPGTPFHLHLDGTDRVLETDAPTVRAALAGIGVELGETTLVTPPLWTPLQAGLAITVTRLVETREERILTATGRVLRDEFLSSQESKIIAPGREGLEESVYRLTFDGPQVLARELVERRVVVAPQPEVRLVGSKGTLPSLPLSGTIAYIANGDAWLMQRESGEKRPLIQGEHSFTLGGLDGRAFDLSADGRTLLFSVAPDPASAQNELWLADTQVLNASPRRTGIVGVSWAGWAPDGRRFAYASLRPTQGAPGLRAQNDLNLVAWPGLTVTQVLSPTGAFLYAWWGESWSWSPDGLKLAYAHADEVGLVELAAPRRRPLYTFPPYHTQADWVWLPTLTWASEHHLLATAHHGAGDEASFALLRFDSRQVEAVDLARDVGPWAGPAYSIAEKTLAFGLRVSAPGAAESYRLHLLDAGAASQPRPLGPEDVATVPYAELCWAPSGRKLVLVREGDLVLLDLERQTAHPLTASGLASHPCWK